MAVTHSDLCTIASRWLRRAHSAGGHGCSLAFTECWSGWGREMPDAIGFRTAPWLSGSIVIECKISRSDFRADSRKPHRQNPGSGMGRWRYYLCPEGLVEPDEVPKGWGLLFATSRGSVKAVSGPAAVLRKHSGCHHAERGFAEACEAWAFERNTEAEALLLARLLSRVQDPEQVNLRIREANGRNAYLIKQLERSRNECDRLRNRVYELRCGAENETDDPLEYAASR